MEVELREAFDQNRYLYALADPVNLADPTGLATAVGVRQISQAELYEAAIIALRYTVMFGASACAGNALLSPRGPCGLKSRHGGRIQVQGADMNPEISYAWNRPSPIWAMEGLLALAALSSQLTKRQLARRTQAFAKAARFIMNARLTGGAWAPISEPFQNYPLPDVPSARVDIVVEAGGAFVFP